VAGAEIERDRESHRGSGTVSTKSFHARSLSHPNAP
jgi:hypothetical protein